MPRTKTAKRWQPSVEPSGTCLYSAAVVVCSADHWVPGGAVLVRDGRIVTVGRRGDFPLQPGYPVIDFGHAAILPGFVNAHAHLEYSGLAGRLAPEAFHRWLPEMIRLKQALTPDEVASGVEDGIAAMRRAGVTTVADISTYDISPAILARSGLHYSVFHEVISLAPRPWRAFLDEVASRCEAPERSGPGAPDFVGIAPHAPYTVSAAVLRALRRRFHGGEGRRFCLHAGESRSEVAFVLHPRGRLWQMLRRAGFYPPGAEDPGIARDFAEFLTAGRSARGPADLLIHGTFLTQADLAAANACTTGSDRHPALVLCPRTREFHGVAPSPIARARQANLVLALGTDSSVSGSRLSPWDEMAVAVRDLAASARDAWRWSTEGGAAALGMQGRRGVVQKDADADFIVVKMSRDEERSFGNAPSSPLPVENWLQSLLRRETSADRWILGSYVAGRRLIS